MTNPVSGYRSVLAPGLFRDQTAVVTGGGDGFGRCMAHGLDALIGEKGMGGKHMFAGLNAERLVFSAMGVGTADLALRETVKYVNERALFGGQPTGACQAVQFLLKLVRPMLTRAADRPGPRPAM